MYITLEQKNMFYIIIKIHKNWCSRIFFNGSAIQALTPLPTRASELHRRKKFLFP